MSDIEWEKIEQKPEKDYKVPGEYLLEQRALVESKNQDLAEKSLTIKHLNEELKNSKAEAETRGNKVKEMIEKFGELNVKFEELNQKLETITKENEELKKELEEIKSEKQTLEDQVNTLKANNELQEDLIKEKDEDIKTLNEEKEQLLQKISELDEKINSMPQSDEFEELKKKLDSYPTPEELEELKKRPDPDQVDNLLIGKDEEIEKLKSDIDSLTQEIEKLKADNISLETANADLVKKLEKAKEGVKESTSIPEIKTQVKTQISALETKTAPPTTIHDIKPPTVETKSPKFTIAENNTTAKFSLTHDAATETPFTKKRKLPEGVINIFNNIKMAIEGGIRAGELHKLLEESRDAIANMIGFSSALKAMGDVARKLKKAPAHAQIDEESVKVFLQKIDEWRHTMEGG
ncbi:MAG: hypothetical protein ACTSRG_06265 [Candidatus Helarchaeota archaeon]